MAGGWKVFRVHIFAAGLLQELAVPVNVVYLN